jgi:hypothetical protein
MARFQDHRARFHESASALSETPQQQGDSMTTIITKYLGATNTKPARIVADAGLKRRVTISLPLDARDPHRCAALALCKKFHWAGTLVQGGMEHGSAFVFVETDATFPIPERD